MCSIPSWTLNTLLGSAYLCSLVHVYQPSSERPSKRRTGAVTAVVGTCAADTATVAPASTASRERIGIMAVSDGRRCVREELLCRSVLKRTRNEPLARDRLGAILVAERVAHLPPGRLPRPAAIVVVFRVH